MRARLLPTASVLLAGLAQAVAVAVPGSGQPLWWLQILSLSVLGWQLNGCAGNLASWSSSTWSDARRRPAWQTDWRGAAWLGWVFATAWLCGTFWWLFISMHTYGGLAAPLAAVAVLALAAALALYYAVACAVLRIPTVVDFRDDEDPCRLIASGDLIRVDGSSGVVEILRRAAGRGY